MNDSPELSILMPCLNEAKTLPVCLEKARRFLAEHQIKGEIIVADNGSTDGSVALAEQGGARVIAVPERGYGAALMGGIAAARGRFVIMGDADDSYDFSLLLPILSKLREGYQLVLGNRFKGGIKPGAMPPLNRWLGNPVLSALGKIFFKIPLNDFHCGLRGFDRKAIQALDLRTTGMEFASEMIVRASLQNLRMAEVPITYWPDGRGHKSHLHPWRDGWRHLRFLLLYSPRWLYLYPGLAMLLFGVVLGGMLLPGPVMIADGVGLDVHSLLVASLGILVGIQSITFGFMARSYAIRNGMIPANSRYEKLFEFLTLERLLLLAGALVLLGLVGISLAAAGWGGANFGALDYRNVLRLLIPSATCLVVGMQLGFAAFFVGIMQIKQR